jgi:membrane associated rhomboid family serine protease
MLPLSDINPTRRIPILTYILIAINVVVFLIQLSYSPRQLQLTFLNDAIVPLEMTRIGWFAPESLLDIIRAMFFHGGWLHIGSNMLYLWIFGDNIEDRFGRVLYLLLYFLSGFAAAYLQIIIEPQSPIPMVGASGSIAGVLGAYLVLFPGVRVRGLLILGIFARIAEFPAALVLGFWFVTQLFSGVASVGANAAVGGGVAFFAHIGGFVAGVIIALLLAWAVPQPPIPQRYDMLYERYGRNR